MSDTPTPITDAILALIPGGQTCDPQLVADELRPKIAELERELAALTEDVGKCHDATECRAKLIKLKEGTDATAHGMKMIANMLSDERALADRLADQLIYVRDGHFTREGVSNSIAAWEASRNPPVGYNPIPSAAEIDAHLDECAARSERDWKPLEGDEE